MQLHGVFIGCHASPQLANIAAWCLEIGKDLKAMAEISFYGRYLDDGLLVWKGSESDLLRWLEQMNTPFRCEHGTCQLHYTMEYSKSSVVFLDFEAFKGPGWTKTGILDTRLYEKTGAPHSYLPPQSCHPSWCFKSWVKAEVCRRLIVSSSSNDFNVAVSKFAKDLIARGHLGSKVRSVLDTVTFEHRTALMGKFAQPSKDGSSESGSRDIRKLYMVLMHHPDLVKLEFNDKERAFLDNGIPEVRHSETINPGLCRKLWHF